MCGIAAVLARPSRRAAPSLEEVRRLLEEAGAALEPVWAGPPAPGDAAGLRAATAALRALDSALRGVPGLEAMLGGPGIEPLLEGSTAAVTSHLQSYESALDRSGLADTAGGVEDLNAAIVALRDSVWALAQDRLGALRSTRELCHGLGLAAVPPRPALGVAWSLHVALRSLDRLEVRGRDSAGLHLMLSGHGLDPGAPEVAALAGGRSGDRLFTSMSVRWPAGCLSIVYKTAAEIGELGDNVRALRRAVASDSLLALALASPDVEATVVAHTRWASVGLISEPNAHPLNSEEGGLVLGPDGTAYAVGALNGDIDNYAALLAEEEIAPPAQVTTDAKLVPTLVARRMACGVAPEDAFRQAVGRFDGSVGIAVNMAREPGRLLLALRGSGQGLNIGLAADAFVVASEPYGLVEEASEYLRMDGEGGGQVVVLERGRAGEMDGARRQRYDGSPLPIAMSEVKRAEITTRDIDRHGFRHFLLKEISEAALSVRKTLRGKLVPGPGGGYEVRLGDEALPATLRRRLADGSIDRAVVVGQGTAAVAGQAVAAALARAMPCVRVARMPATELSGWGPDGTGLPDDLTGMLVVAISQSGTTTDTNRTVDLVRARGALVVSIVNRRNSDLVHKSDGVLYTSDGRDVEMSVASTKAFYSQIAAGHLLAAGMTACCGPGLGRDRQDVLAALRDLPDHMATVLAKRTEIAMIAAAVAPPRRNWAVTGSGPDHVAAAELRIKLSELCYKSIALDTVEDKKHIDLSSEPMVIVCAAGTSGANARDLAKEVAIFKAHKAAPVVVVSESQRALFGDDVDVVAVPDTHPELAFVLAAMVGHIFGYEAALSIDAQAHPLREARSLIERSGLPAAVVPALEAVTAPAVSGLRSGAYDGNLSASSAGRLTSLLRYATGALPVEGYEAEMGKVGSPSALAEDLLAALGAAIDELARPIDAIKHQAKTVTVGISRSEDDLLRSQLVAEALGAGASAGSLGYRALRSLAALAPAVHGVLGFTRYHVELAPASAPQADRLAGATISVVDRGGISAGMVSRSAADPTLRGTKHRAAEKREVTVFRGLHDGRTGVMVPEVKDGQVVGMTLLHVQFEDRLSPVQARAVLEGYQGRYAALVDAVTEARPGFDDDVLAMVPVIDLLTEPVAVLAGNWSAQEG